MLESRYSAAATMFEGNEDLWWVTGGELDDVKLKTTEIYNSSSGFESSIDLPKRLEHHNLVNINETHTVLLGGDILSNNVYIIDK